MALSHLFASPSSRISPGASLSQDSFAAGLAGSPATPWVRFSWQTASLGAAPGGADLIRPATREEGDDVLRVLLLSLSMDAAWNDSFARAEHHLREVIGRLFNTEEPLCLVVPKGNRLIAASLLEPVSEAPSHLVSGPAVLMEYRNRGIGSRLLHASLSVLRDRGLSTATGITRDRTIAARHVYPKFGGKSEAVILSKSDPAETHEEKL